MLGFETPTAKWAFFSGAPIPLAYLASDGRFLEVNDAWTELVGYSAHELEGKTVQQITHPDDLASDVAMMERLMVGNTTTRSYAMVKRYLRKNNMTVWVHLHVRAVWDETTHKFQHFIAWALPLPNHGKFKAEVQSATGEVHVRPIIKIGEFFADNWKTVIPWGGVVAYFVVRFVMRFLELLDKNGIEW